MHKNLPHSSFLFARLSLSFPSLPLVRAPPRRLGFIVEILPISQFRFRALGQLKKINAQKKNGLDGPLQGPSPRSFFSEGQGEEEDEDLATLSARAGALALSGETPRERQASKGRGQEQVQTLLGRASHRRTLTPGVVSLHALY